MKAIRVSLLMVLVFLAIPCMAIALEWQIETADGDPSLAQWSIRGVLIHLEGEIGENDDENLGQLIVRRGDGTEIQILLGDLLDTDGVGLDVVGHGLRGTQGTDVNSDSEVITNNDGDFFLTFILPFDTILGTAGDDTDTVEVYFTATGRDVAGGQSILFDVQDPLYEDADVTDGDDLVRNGDLIGIDITLKTIDTWIGDSAGEGIKMLTILPDFSNVDSAFAGGNSPVPLGPVSNDNSAPSGRYDLTIWDPTNMSPSLDLFDLMLDVNRARIEGRLSIVDDGSGDYEVAYIVSATNFNSSGIKRVFIHAVDFPSSLSANGVFYSFFNLSGSDPTNIWADAGLGAFPAGLNIATWQTTDDLDGNGGPDTADINLRSQVPNIDSYYPNDPGNPTEVEVGQSVTLGVIFTNTSNTPWQFVAGATVSDSNGNTVGSYDETLDTALQPGQQATVEWSHTVSAVGDYWVQFRVWKDNPFAGASDGIDNDGDGEIDEPDEALFGWDGENLLDKKPSPSERLIIGKLVLPDLSISAIRPVQVVWDADINSDNILDLVAGKSTMVRVELSMVDYSGLPSQEIIEISLTIPQLVNSSVSPRVYTEQKTVEQLEQDNRIDFYPSYPIPIGDHTITAEVDPGKNIQEADETNNEAPIEVTVRNTKPLRIEYFRISSVWPANYGIPDPEDFARLVNQGGDLILATYPIAEDNLVNEAMPGVIHGAKTPWAGKHADLVALNTMALLRGADRVIGVVSDAYFAYHGACCLDTCTRGLSLLGLNGVLVQEGLPIVVPHEIGHTYELVDEYEYDKDNCKITYPGDLARGFWVDRREAVENSICFMGTAAPNNRWICNSSYEDLFRKSTHEGNSETVPLRSYGDNLEDSLLISGLIFENGTIEPCDWYYLKNGIIEPPSDYPLSGDLSIQLLDKEGTV